MNVSIPNMGLDNAWSRICRRAVWRAWAVPVALILAAGGLELAGEWSRAWLSFDRAAITAGEAWRLLTGHIVHLGVSHYLMNAAGLVLVWLLVGNYLSPARWLFTGLTVIAGIDLGFWIFATGLQWYVGLSGLLHGLLAAGILAGWRAGDRDTAWLVVLVAAKLAYEQFAGPLPGSEPSAGGPVIVDAHLYGAVTGVVAALFLPVSRRRGSI